MVARLVSPTVTPIESGTTVRMLVSIEYQRTLPPATATPWRDRDVAFRMRVAPMLGIVAMFAGLPAGNSTVLAAGAEITYSVSSNFAPVVAPPTVTPTTFA